MHDFSIQMTPRLAHKQYPEVNATLHAGELTFGQVMPTDLGHHIRESIERGHRLRIGHGVDVMYDRMQRNCLAKMQKRRSWSKSTSAAMTRSGVKGKDHIPYYLKAGVPVALSTMTKASRASISHTSTRVQWRSSG